MQDLKSDILAEANHLGFFLAGVARPDPPISYGVFEHWLEAGGHADMAYMATERARLRRSDPRLILPEVKSILVLGFPYRAPVEPDKTQERDLSGWVAAYAAGEDYHLIIPPLLERIALFAQERAGQPVKWRGYTDTGPILEREFAMRAGLGWIGKNSCLISPKFGSYFLLAEILWDIPLEADAAVDHDYCGSCTRCIDACPTGCIQPDRTLDAKKCISYLTIENKREIPSELRPFIGEWVFGCDVCQQVCPWNVRFAPARPEPAFPGPPEMQHIGLINELGLSPQTFNRQYRRSPILRARRRGYLRNVCVALGNQANPSAVPQLSLILLTEPESLVRVHAAWALGQLRVPEAFKALMSALQTETEPQVLVEIERALQKF